MTSRILGEYVELNGIRTYFESFGSGKVNVLLIHTAGRDNRQWHEFMVRLGDRYRLFAPDLPGHGKTWPVRNTWCYDDVFALADWLWAFCKCLSIEKPVIIGCSLGGNLVLLEAALHPLEVAAVVALQGSDYTPTFSEVSLDLMTHPQVSLMHTNMDFSMSLVGSNASDSARMFSEWGVLSLIPLAQQADLRAYARCDIRRLMEHIVCPVLLTHGTADWLVSEEMVRSTSERIINSNNVRFKSLDGLGHFPHLEGPEKVAEVVIEFLSDVL